MVGNGAVVVALGPVGDAAVVVGDGISWVHFDDLRVVGNRALVVTLCAIGDTAVVIGDGISWIDLDGLGVVGNGAIVLALVVVDVATSAIGDRQLLPRVRTQGDHVVAGAKRDVGCEPAVLIDAPRPVWRLLR